MTVIVQGARDAAGEVAGLVLLVLLLWLATRVCRTWDRAAARRRRRAIAEARALAAAPPWVTPEMVHVRDGRVIGVRRLARLDDADGQVASLKSMMARSHRVGAR